MCTFKKLISTKSLILSQVFILKFCANGAYIYHAHPFSVKFSQNEVPQQTNHPTAPRYPLIHIHGI